MAVRGPSAWVVAAFAAVAGAAIGGPGPIRKILAHLGEPLEPPPVSPARGPPTDWGELVQVHFRPGNLSGTDRRAARHRYP